MKIWYLNHFASTPDQPTTGAYFLMDALAERGHDVTVFASGFNYYLRNYSKMAGKTLMHAERVDKVNFLWLRTFPTQGRIFSRLLNMGSYAMLAFMAGLLHRPKPDVIISTCPHPPAAAAAWLLSKLYGVRFVYEIRDIWPESMTESNLVSDKNLLVRLMMALQLFLYRRAFLLTSVIPKFDDYLRSKGIERFRFLWLPNGIRVGKGELLAPSGGPEAKDAPFRVFYFGGHSKHQALDIVLDAAALLMHDSLPVKFILVGEGTEKPRLVQKAKDMHLTNLEFRAAVPRLKVKEAAAEADCFIAHNRPIPALRFGGGLNKICDFMLAGRPIINGSATGNDPVGDNQCGITIPPMDPQAIVDAIRKIHALSVQERRAMGERAQAYAVKQFDAARLAGQLDEALTQV